ncbi:MAG: hypothetical protein V2A73_17785 [Pseudomonadota bacterium]
MQELERDDTPAAASPIGIVATIVVASVSLLSVGGCADNATCQRATCTELGKDCGEIDDGCGALVDCGQCSSPLVCGGAGAPNVCAVCTKESDGDYCIRLGKNCDPVTQTDNCGETRTVDCGQCAFDATCGGGGVLNVCHRPGCTAETDEEICAEYRRQYDCGLAMVWDSCGGYRRVDCGSCDGCVSISAEALCARLGYECGKTYAIDNCCRPRPDLDCGACVEPEICGGGGTKHQCGTGACEAQIESMGTWTRVDAGESNDLNAIWGSDDEDIWVVGDAGTILHYDGGWHHETSPTPYCLSAIHGTSSRHAWAVGGPPIRWNGESWAVVDDGTVIAPLFSVFAAREDSVWAGGEYADTGTFFHYDGTDWTYIPPFSDYVVSLFALPAGPAWLGTLDGEIISLATNNQVTSLGHHGSSIIWASSPSDLWAIGSDIEHFDGSDWQLVAKGGLPYQLIFGGHFVSANDIWGVGHACYWFGEGRECGLIRHWDGTSWKLVENRLAERLNDAWESPSGRVWIVGARGTILRLDP